MKKRYSVH